MRGKNEYLGYRNILKIDVVVHCPTTVDIYDADIFHAGNGKGGRAPTQK